MADVDLKLQDLTVPELISAGARLADGLTNNQHFPAPSPSPTAIEALVQKLTAAQEEYRVHRNRLAELNATRDAIADDLKAILTQGAVYVQTASEGDAEKILSANLHVEHGFSMWPFGSLDQVEELSASAGDQPGEIDLAWDPLSGAAGYEVEISRDVAPYGPWEPAAASGQSKTTLEQLTRKQRYWIRVRAVTEDKTGDWSDPVMKTAP